MPKAMPLESDGKLVGHMIFCPACECGHLFDASRWPFNGDCEKPTFTPSMLVRCNDQTSPHYSVHIGSSVCHSHVTAGKIQFLNDCTHKLAGQIVDLPDFDTMDQ